MIGNVIYIIFWNFFWIPVRLFFKFFLNFKVETQEDLKRLKGPLIIVANHNTLLDSFLVGNAFPWRSSIFPIRFACLDKYYYHPLLFFLRSFGAFPIKKGLGVEKNLEFAIKIIQNRGVVGIFPEGGRKFLPKPEKGKKGTAYLAIKTNTPILPVFIEGNSKGLPLNKIFARKLRITVKIGKPFKIKSKDLSLANLDQETKRIIKKIRDLAD